MNFKTQTRYLLKLNEEFNKFSGPSKLILTPTEFCRSDLKHPGNYLICPGNPRFLLVIASENWAMRRVSFERSDWAFRTQTLGGQENFLGNRTSDLRNHAFVHHFFGPAVNSLEHN